MTVFSSFRYKNLIFLLLFLPLIDSEDLSAQVLNDSVSLQLVKDAVDHIYNMRFVQAGEYCDQISKKYPQHPVVYLLRGMIIYWKNYPVMSGTPEGIEFEKQVRMCMTKCESYKPENEAEFLLANLCARGSLLAYYAGNNLHSKILSLARPSYRYLRLSFQFTGTFPDFFFFTGLYNYYREAYPAAHPAYKPIFAIFPRGDKVKGMDQLRTAFHNSIFLKAEASTFLSSNYKYFENNYRDASYFSKSIYMDYPNIIYMINCVEDLLLIKNYDQAEKIINSPQSKTDNKYYNAQITILKGILNEKKNKDLIKAEQLYSDGINQISQFGSYGDQYSAYAWFGLSRISGMKKDYHNQRAFRRKALGLADFENVTFDN